MCITWRDRAPPYSFAEALPENRFFVQRLGEPQTSQSELLLDTSRSRL
jgi:hypothetical protein